MKKDTTFLLASIAPICFFLATGEPATAQDQLYKPFWSSDKEEMNTRINTRGKSKKEIEQEKLIQKLNTSDLVQKKMRNSPVVKTVINGKHYTIVQKYIRATGNTHWMVRAKGPNGEKSRWYYCADSKDCRLKSGQVHKTLYRKGESAAPKVKTKRVYDESKGRYVRVPVTHELVKPELNYTEKQILEEVREVSKSWILRELYGITPVVKEIRQKQKSRWLPPEQKPKVEYYERKQPYTKTIPRDGYDVIARTHIPPTRDILEEEVWDSARLVRETLEKDGVLNPDNEEHAGAVSRLLDVAILSGRDSPEYQAELETFNGLRRSVIKDAVGQDCTSGSATARLGKFFRDRGFALRNAKQTKQAIKHLMQSLELCHSAEVEQALAALQNAGAIEGIYAGRVTYTATISDKKGPISHSMTGTIRLQLSQGQVSGQITARRSLRTDNRGAQVVSVRISNGSFRDSQFGAQITGKSAHEDVQVRQGSAPQKSCPPGIIAGCVGGRATTGPPPGVIDLFTNLIGTMVSNYTFEGTIAGVIDGSSARGSFRGSGIKSGSPVRVSGEWRATRQ